MGVMILWGEWCYGGNGVMGGMVLWGNGIMVIMVSHQLPSLRVMSVLSYGYVCLHWGQGSG